MMYGNLVSQLGQPYVQDDAQQRVPMRTLLQKPGDSAALPLPSGPLVPTRRELQRLLMAAPQVAQTAQQLQGNDTRSMSGLLAALAGSYQR